MHVFMTSNGCEGIAAIIPPINDAYNPAYKYI